MKKSVLLFIGVVFIASILIIGFFGMEQVVYEEPNYVTSITCKNTGATIQKDGSYLIVIGKDEPGILLDYRLNTKNGKDPTNRRVSFTCSDTSGIVEVNSIGSVVFNTDQAAYATIVVRSLDPKGASVVINVYRPAK